MTVPTDGIVQTGFLLDDFSDPVNRWKIFGAENPAFSRGEDAVNFHEGANSMRISATDDSAQRYNRFNAIGADLSGVDVFTLWLYVPPGSTPPQSLICYFSSDASEQSLQNASATILLQGSGNFRSDNQGAMVVTFTKTDFFVAGSSPVDWSNVTNVNINVNFGDGAGEISIDSLYVGRRTQPHLVLMFDDGFNSTSFPMLDKITECNAAGIPVTQALVPTLLNTAGFLTTEQALEKAALGNPVVVHSGINYLTLSPGEVADDINTAQAQLAAEGFNTSDLNYFVWPGGQISNNVGESFLASVENNTSIQQARSISGQIQIANSVESVQQGLIDPLVINAQSIAAGLATVQAAIDKAIQWGTTIFLYIHRVSAGSASPPATEMIGEDFTALIQYIKDRADLGYITPVSWPAWSESLMPTPSFSTQQIGLASSGGIASAADIVQ